MNRSIITVAILAFLVLTRCWGKCRLNDWVYNANYKACIRLFTDHKNYKDAVSTCNYYGSVLIMPKTAAKEQALDDLIREDGSGAWVWIGANDIDRETYWYWSDGGTLSWNNFSPGKPDGGDNQNCAMVDNKYLWDDQNCDVETYFACEEIKPTLQISPRDSIIHPNIRLRLTCIFDQPLEGVRYRFHDGTSSTNRGSSNMLSTTKRKLGLYRMYCDVIHPPSGGVFKSSPRSIAVADPPKLLKKPARPRVPGSTKSVFTCAFGPAHLETIRYTFYYYDEVVQHGTNNTMEITRSGLIDSGSYKCTTTYNRENPIPSDRIDLTVQETPRLDVYPPERSIQSGTKIDILCKLTATNPEVIYTFVHEKVPLQTGKDNHYVLEHAEMENSGDFSCTAQYRNFREESRKHTILVTGVGCPVPAVTDDYTRRLLDSITPREETRRWRKQQTVEPDRKPRDEL